jgi:hypothetical protein
VVGLFDGVTVVIDGLLVKVNLVEAGLLEEMSNMQYCYMVEIKVR